MWPAFCAAAEAFGDAVSGLAGIVAGAAFAAACLAGAFFAAAFFGEAFFGEALVAAFPGDVVFACLATRWSHVRKAERLAGSRLVKLVPIG